MTRGTWQADRRAAIFMQENLTRARTLTIRSSGELPRAADMIQLTRLNNSSLILNSDLFEYLEATPDTVITLSNGHKYVVLEDPDEILRRIVQFRRHITALPAVEESRG